MFYMRDTDSPIQESCEPGRMLTTRPELQLKPDISTFHPNRKPASPPQSDVKTISNNAQESSDQPECQIFVQALFFVS